MQDNQSAPPPKKGVLIAALIVAALGIALSWAVASNVRSELESNRAWNNSIGGVVEGFLHGIVLDFGKLDREKAEIQGMYSAYRFWSVVFWICVGVCVWAAVGLAGQGDKAVKT